METVTISQREYRELVRKKLRYDYLRHVMEQDPFAPPPVRNRREVVRAFRATKRYSQKFLQSLEKGLRRSRYFRA